MELGNLFRDVPESLPEELFETLAEHGQVRIERIVSRGHASPEDFWYDQEQHEFIVVVAGSARLHIEGEPEPRELTVGDYLNIPAHQKHRVDATDASEPTIWLAVFYGP